MPKKPSNTQKDLIEVQQLEEQAADSAQKPLNFTPKNQPETPQQIALYDKAVFTWIAPEYIQHPKSKNWYTIAAVIAAIFVIGALLFGDWTMALAIVVLGAVYLYVHAHHPPQDIKITISKMGIKVGNMIFPYTSIQAFWIIYHPPHVMTLNLRVKEHFFSDVIIQLNHEDPVPVREFLCGQIPEWSGKTEKFGDIVLRLLKL